MLPQISRGGDGLGKKQRDDRDFLTLHQPSNALYKLSFMQVLRYLNKLFVNLLIYLLVLQTGVNLYFRRYIYF